jgi:hypothetical protein
MCANVRKCDSGSWRTLILATLQEPRLPRVSLRTACATSLQLMPVSLARILQDLSPVLYEDPSVLGYNAVLVKTYVEGFLSHVYSNQLEALFILTSLN